MRITRHTAQDITIETARNEFITCKKTEGLSVRTIESYEYAIEYLCNNLCINIHNSVGVLTQDKWLEFIGNLQKQQLTKSGINHFVTSCRVFLYWCMSNGYIEEYKIKLIKGQEPKIKLYSNDEMEKLMHKPTKGCSYPEYRDWVIVAFILSTGARASTILNIKIEDLDLVGGTVAYRHLKNKKAVSIPLPPNTCKILIDYIHTWGLTDYLFPNHQNEQMSYNALESSFRRYCISRGVKCTGLHTLRHTFCSSLVKQNVNPFIIQKIMTHSSIAVTEKYVHLFSNDLDEVTEVVPANKYLTDRRIKRVKQIHQLTLVNLYVTIVRMFIY